jgi:D-glycero-D-manno-heptose 1,7-bisphosphate phosphatase
MDNAVSRAPTRLASRTLIRSTSCPGRPISVSLCSGRSPRRVRSLGVTNLDSIRLLVFDADGTLRRTTVPGQPCPNAPHEWELIAGVREQLAVIDWDRIAFGLCSNQGGVGMGLLSALVARTMLEQLALDATGRSWPEEAVQMCPHAPRAGCRCRKPEPEMLRRIMRHYHAEADETLYVGDLESDERTAERAGVRFTYAARFFGWDRTP